MKRSICILVCLFLTASMLLAEPYPVKKDWRNLLNAVAEIPSEGYCDLPYLPTSRHWKFQEAMLEGRTLCAWADSVCPSMWRRHPCLRIGRQRCLPHIIPTTCPP